jgi:hypothetical protein
MLTLKTLSPENGIVGIGRWVPAPSRQQSLTRERRESGDARGSEVASSLTLRLRGNQGELPCGHDSVAPPGNQAGTEKTNRVRSWREELTYSPNLSSSMRRVWKRSDG